MKSPDPIHVHEHLPLHPLEFQILLCLTGGVTHAYDIVRGIEERQPDWNKILPTNLYRRIWRLAEAGLVEEVQRDLPPGERPRKYFGITPAGLSVAQAEAARLRGLLLEAERAGVSPTTEAPT